MSACELQWHIHPCTLLPKAASLRGAPQTSNRMKLQNFAQRSDWFSDSHTSRVPVVQGLNCN